MVDDQLPVLPMPEAKRGLSRLIWWWQGHLPPFIRRILWKLVVLAHEAGRPENESVAATAEAAQAAETMVVHTNDQRLQIAQSLKSSLNQEFQPNISMLNTDQIYRHACDLATAPDWMKECYNTQQNFTVGTRWLQCASEFILPHWHEDTAVDAGSHG